MKDHKITKDEQSCVASCITTHWGNPGRPDAADDEKRDRDYEQCLADCRICG